MGADKWRQHRSCDPNYKQSAGYSGHTSPCLPSVYKEKLSAGESQAACIVQDFGVPLRDSPNFRWEIESYKLPKRG
jgi:hypothetical protein